MNLLKLRVLIVDDNALMRTLISENLRRIGIHDIQEAADGKAALVAAIKFQPNLVLCDIHMEPMNGIEFVKQLRGLPYPTVAEVRVILMTADASKETLTAVIPLSIRGFIVKPPTLVAMKEKIEHAMK